MDKTMQSLSINEALLLDGLDHPGVIKLDSWQKSNNGDKVLLVLEYCPYGDLHKFLLERLESQQNLEDWEVYKIVEDLAQGFLYI